MNASALGDFTVPLTVIQLLFAFECGEPAQAGNAKANAVSRAQYVCLNCIVFLQIGSG
jgi:hypothetical protein